MFNWHSWIKSQVLPQRKSSEVNSTFEGIENDSNQGDLKEDIFWLSKLIQELDTRDPFNERLQDVVDDSTAQRWSNIEENKEILKMLMQYVTQAMQQVESGEKRMKVDQHNGYWCGKRDFEVIIFARSF